MRTTRQRAATAFLISSAVWLTLGALLLGYSPGWFIVAAVLALISAFLGARRIRFAAVLLLIVSATVAVSQNRATERLYERVRRIHTPGREHIFPLLSQPPFLTEELALIKAKETLERDGFNPTQWEPQADGRSIAPDGRRDEFAGRNTINSNRVVFVFKSQSAEKRFVAVELRGTQVVGQISIPK